MEASEKPQLPLDDVTDGSVRAIGDRLVIEALTLSDERSARVVRQRAEAGQPPADTVAKAIEIGARVLDREEVAAEVDYVKREFERLAAEHREQIASSNQEAAERIEGELRRVFGSDDVEGALTAALEGHSGELSEQLAALFGEGREGAVQAKIKHALEVRDQAFLDRLSADDELNPLRPLLTTVRNWAKERREDQNDRDRKLEEKLDEVLQQAAELAGLQRGSEQLEAEQARGTAKGRGFEERVHQVIDQIAAGRGDVAHHVGDVSGDTRGKKGDTVVEIGASTGPALAKIAFDPKNVSNLGRPKAWDVLNGSLEDRGADFAVLVVAGEDNVPAKTQTLCEYEGNKMIVAVDRDEPERVVLETAYALARARALAQHGDELALDAHAMKAAIDEARRAVESLKKARQALTGMRKNADSIEEALSTMEEGVKTALGRADTLIADALESAA